MRLLVVEDEPDLAKALATGLRAEGYTVDLATDGLAGLQYARTTEYAIIILDLMLPHLSGYAVTRELRGAKIHVPILVLTAKSGDADHTEALDSGADDVVVKPFSFPVLLARLRALSRRRSPVTTVLLVGDLELNLMQRTCQRGETLIPLSRREFDLLELLANHPFEPISKSAILAAFWPSSNDPNVIEARIASLRRKIDAPFGRSSVETVRGVGYRLVDDRQHVGR